MLNELINDEQIFIEENEINDDNNANESINKMGKTYIIKRELSRDYFLLRSRQLFIYFILLFVLIFILGFVTKIILYIICYTNENNFDNKETNNTVVNKYNYNMCISKYIYIRHNVFSDFLVFTCHMIMGTGLLSFYYFINLLYTINDIYFCRKLDPYIPDDYTLVRA